MDEQKLHNGEMEDYYGIKLDSKKCRVQFIHYHINIM